MLCTSGLTSPNLDEESIGYRAVPFFEGRRFLSEVREHVVGILWHHAYFEGKEPRMKST
jgi:hypothetical protein